MDSTPSGGGVAGGGGCPHRRQRPRWRLLQYTVVRRGFAAAPGHGAQRPQRATLSAAGAPGVRGAALVCPCFFLQIFSGSASPFLRRRASIHTRLHRAAGGSYADASCRLLRHSFFLAAAASFSSRIGVGGGREGPRRLANRELVRMIMLFSESVWLTTIVGAFQGTKTVVGGKNVTKQRARNTHAIFHNSSTTTTNTSCCAVNDANGIGNGEEGDERGSRKLGCPVRGYGDTAVVADTPIWERDTAPLPYRVLLSRASDLWTPEHTGSHNMLRAVV